MSRCNFCDREFENAQAVRAHLKTCANYQKSKKGTAMRIHPLTSSRPQTRATSQGGPAPTPLTTPSDVVANLVDHITRQFAGPDEATRLKRKREALLAGLCNTLVDGYRPLEGVVLPEMAVAAKVAIIDELGAFAIEELSHAELTLRGTAIRNRVFAPYARSHEELVAHQHEKQQQDALQRQHKIDACARQTTRKTALIELGLSRALKSASPRGLPTHALVLLELEVRLRLEAWLVGDETETQVDETIEAAIERPLLEWETRMEQWQSARRQRIVNHCLTAALPIVEATLPWVKETVIKKVRETFGLQPTPPAPTSAASDASTNEGDPKHADAPTPRPIRRRRSSPSSSATTPSEMGAESESDDVAASVRRSATR